MRITVFVIPVLLIACLTLSRKSPSQKQLEKLFPKMLLDVDLPTAHSGKNLQKATED